MFLGYYLKKREVITSGFLASGNKLVYYVALPALLFRGVYSTEIGAFMDIRFISFTLGSAIVAFFIIWRVAAIFLKEEPVLASFAQGAYRGSFALLGTPLIINLSGDAGMARAALVMVFVIPFFNVFSILALAPCTGEKLNMLNVIWTVAKNPSNVMIVLGIIMAVFGIPLPVMAEGAINTTANLATPLALLCLGGGITFHGVDSKFKYAMLGSIIKVAIMPAIVITIAVLFGFRDYDLAVITMLFGVPSAVVGYAMAAQMGGDTYIASTIVVFSTIMSAVTLTVFIYVLRVMGLLVV